MTKKSTAPRKPKVSLTATDHAKLSVLAAQIADRSPDIADELMNELDRAKVVPDKSLAKTVVQMGSQVTYQPNNGDPKTVTLVFPGDADISSGKISILTPIGTALIGLSVGQSMGWVARDGKTHQLEILDVQMPEVAAHH